MPLLDELFSGGSNDGGVCIDWCDAPSGDGERAARVLDTKDQERDDHGRFGAGDGSGKKPPKAPKAPKQNAADKKQAAMSAASDAISNIKEGGGALSPQQTAELTNHLSNLTVPQLKELQQQHGLEASGKTKEALKNSLLASMSDRATSESPKQPAPAAAGTPAPQYAKIAPNAVEGWTQKNYGAWGKGLSEGEVKAVDMYTTASSGQMNSHLRNPSWVPALFGPSKAISTATANLTSALDKASTPENVIAYRGMRSSSGFDPTKMLGTTFVDKGFGSCTLDKSTAEEFSQRMGKGKPIVMSLIVPKGTKAAMVGAAPTDTTKTGESELLMQRGAKYQVLQHQEIDGVHHLVCKVVP